MLEPKEIVTLLIEKGFSSYTLAQEVGVAQTTIVRIGLGKIAKPNFELVDRLRKVAAEHGIEVGHG